MPRRRQTPNQIGACDYATLGQYGKRESQVESRWGWVEKGDVSHLLVEHVGEETEAVPACEQHSQQAHVGRIRGCHPAEVSHPPKTLFCRSVDFSDTLVVMELARQSNAAQRAADRAMPEGGSQCSSALDDPCYTSCTKAPCPC